MSAPYLDPRRRRDPFRRGGYGAAPQFQMNTFTGDVGHDRSADRVSAPSSIKLGAAGEMDRYGADEKGNPFIKTDRQLAQEQQANNDIITARDAGAKDARLGSEYAKGYAGGATIPANPFAAQSTTGAAGNDRGAQKNALTMAVPPTDAAMGKSAATAARIPQSVPPVPIQPTTPDETASALFTGRQKQIAPAVTSTPGVNSVSGPGGTATGTRQDPFLTAQQRAQQGTVAIPGGNGIPAQNVSTSEAQRLASPQTRTLPDGSTKQVPSLLSVTDGPGAINNSVTQNNVAGAVQNAAKTVTDKKSKPPLKYRSPFPVNRST